MCGLWRGMSRRLLRGDQTDMRCRNDFIKGIVSDMDKKNRDAAVFVVELGEDVEPETLEKAKAMLEGLVGEERLTFFRVR